MTEAAAKGIAWDLNDLYSAMDDPRIHDDLDSARVKAKSFEAAYKPLFEGLTLETAYRFPLRQLISDYESIAEITTRIGVFSHLLFAQKTDAEGVGAFMQQIQVALTDIGNHLLFFEVSFNRLPESVARAIMDVPEHSRYRHFLEKMRIFAPHTLSEPEERIVNVAANTGRRAFSRLFDERINRITFNIEIEGRIETKNESEILALQHSPERDLRHKAALSLSQGLQEETHLLTFVYNMILADHRSSMQLRGYKHPMDSMNLSNEVSMESILNLIRSVKSAYPIAWKYYGLKKKLLGLDTLYEYDRYAPIGHEDRCVSFEQCRKIVLEGYFHFSEAAGQIAELFFSRRWIDAEIRPGKHGGGFSCQTTPQLHPYILVNYTGSMRDVMTVAHELGHGIHQYTASRSVGILESDAPLTMAETASVFGEMLIFDKILEAETDPKVKLSLLCGKIDDQFATVFRQICMTDFELKAHESGLAKGELSSDALSEFWMSANREFYGPSVELTDGYRHGWKYIPHFVHSPFYCYAYAFAQLFVLSLYKKYKSDHKGFVPKYMEMLSFGGSRSPDDCAKHMGLDIAAPQFWQDGLALLNEMVVEAELLADQLEKAR